MKRNIMIVCAVALALASCTKKFEEMNKDPFSPTGTTIEALFNGVVSSLQQSMNEQFYLQNEIWYPETELGALTSESWGNSQIGTSNVWSDYYLMLSNIRELERRLDAYGEEKGDAAVCDKVRAQLNVMKAYQTFKVTDIFGDMPYSQAGRIWENPSSQATMKPEWDTQESIYKSLLEELVQARDLLHSDSISTANGNDYYKLPYDVLLNNDYVLWAEFANSLILRHALRMYDKDPNYATPLLVEAYNFIYTKMSASGGVSLGGGICLWPSVLGTNWDVNWSFREHKHLRMGETIWSCLSSTDDMDGSGIFDYRTYLFFDTSHKNDSFPDGAWRPYPQIPHPRNTHRGRFALRPKPRRQLHLQRPIVPLLALQLLPDPRRAICASNPRHLRRRAVYEGRNRGEEHRRHHAFAQCRRIHPLGRLSVVPLLDPHSGPNQPLDLLLSAIH